MWAKISADADERFIVVMAEQQQPEYQINKYSEKFFSDIQPSCLRANLYPRPASQQHQHQKSG